MTTNTVTKLEISSNYDLMKRFNFNRDVDEKRCGKLAALIKKYGFICPIIITSDNYIIDGQHRYYAAKIAKKEYTYIVLNYNHEDTELLATLISSMNATAKTWPIRQYFKMWCDLEKKEFLNTKDLLEDYDFLIDEFLNIFRGVSKFVRTGDLKLSDNMKDELKKISQFAAEIYNVDNNIMNLKKNKRFRSALFDLLKHNLYNHNRFMKFFPESTGLFQKKHNKASFLTLLEKIHNTNLQKNKIRITR
jgi:hypothetical protein